jgi:hypothetical protein
MTYHRLSLIELEGMFAICKLASDMSIPAWAAAGQFCSITRTSDELSIVCDTAVVPDEIQCERGWRCLRVAGTIPFNVVGILATLVTPLAEARISVFAVSTFDTDYLLVKEHDLDQAVTALRQHGHSVVALGKRRDQFHVIDPFQSAWIRQMSHAHAAP